MPSREDYKQENHMVWNTEVLGRHGGSWLKEAHSAIVLLGGQSWEERFQLVAPFQGGPQPTGSREVGWAQDPVGSSYLAEGVTMARVRSGAQD